MIEFIKKEVIAEIQKEEGLQDERIVNLIMFHKGVSEKLAKECLQITLDYGLLKRFKDKIVVGRKQ